MNRFTADQVKLGFVGVGAMGSRLVRRLVDHGYQVIVFDQNQSAVDELRAIGASAGKSLAEFGGPRFQRLIRQGCDLRLKGVDGVDAGLVSLDPPVVGGAEKLAGERADHAKFLLLRFGVAAVTWSTRLPINSS